jgi:DNA-binding transcriptional LysR family regulator
MGADMNWDDLRFFHVASVCKNFSEAAANLNVRHTTLSRRIKRLESKFRVRLFVRTNQGMVLTKNGSELATVTLGVYDLFQKLYSGKLFSLPD